jgi:hypothetical protein
VQQLIIKGDVQRVLAAPVLRHRTAIPAARGIRSSASAMRIMFSALAMRAAASGIRVDVVWPSMVMRSTGKTPCPPSAWVPPTPSSSPNCWDSSTAWLRSDRGDLAAALARFAGSAAYRPDALRDDSARFRFLLGVTDGEGSGGQSPCFCPGSRGD